MLSADIRKTNQREQLFWRIVFCSVLNYLFSWVSILSNSQETADLVTFTEEILNKKLHFLCSAIRKLCLSGINYLFNYVRNKLCLICWILITIVTCDSSGSNQGDFIWQEVLRTFIQLFEVRWNDHLVNYFYFSLMHRCRINTNLLPLTLCRGLS